MPTKIEWCDETINPVVGCTKCSPGCVNCYAEKFAARLAKNPKTAARYSKVVDERGRWNGRVDIDFSCFDKLPRQPKSIFLASMGDIFHESVSSDSINTLLTLIADRREHQFCLLTKRAKRLAATVGELADYRLSVQKAGADFLNSPAPLPSEIHHPGIQWPLKNLWLGVTVCNQEEADEKIPALLAAPAAHRFVSVEPMLGLIDLGKYFYGSYECALSCGHRQSADELPEKRCLKCGFVGPDDYETWGNGDSEECPECHAYAKVEEVCPNCGTYMVQEHPDTPCIDWVIVGGETGPGARPMHPHWVRSLRDQCRAAKMPFFFKGWGEWAPRCGYRVGGGPDFSEIDPYCRKWPRVIRLGEHGLDMRYLENVNEAAGEEIYMQRVGRKEAGRLLDGVEHNERPW